MKPRKPKIIWRVAFWWIDYGSEVPALGPYVSMAQATYIAAHLGYWPVAK